MSQTFWIFSLPRIWKPYPRLHPTAPLRGAHYPSPAAKPAGCNESRREETAAHFLANPRHNLTSDQQKEIREEVLNLFQRPDYAPLFGPDSRAEVPLTGKRMGISSAGQVDRLCLHGNEVWIVDYKTNRPPPATAAEAPLAYRRQLAAYRAALQDIYPDKTIRCFLLWTYEPKLMELPEEALSH